MFQQWADGLVGEIHNCVFHWRITKMHTINFIKAALTQMGLDCRSINGLQLTLDLHMGVSSVGVGGGVNCTFATAHAAGLKDSCWCRNQLAALVPVNLNP